MKNMEHMHLSGKYIAAVLLVCGGISCKGPKPSEHGAEQASGEEIAREYAMQAQQALGQTLKEKLAGEGPVGAIEFCKVEALPITDSVARSLGVRIRRVTDRPRNPLNRASDAEIALITQWKDSAVPDAAGLAVQLQESDSTHFYFPIRTQALCLNCHGSPGQEIPPEVFQALQLKYPADTAYFYGLDELRGLWKVSFDNASAKRTP